MRAPLDAIAEFLWGPEPILAVQHFFGPAWERLFQVVSLFGDAQFVVLAFAVVFWLRGRRLAYGLLGAVLLGALVDGLLWATLGVPRPDDPRIIVRADPNVPSFPSGHTVTATIVWGWFALLGWLLGVLVALIVGLVIVSRLYLGVHYLGDVLVAPLLGLALLFIAWRLWPHVWPRLTERSPRLYRVGASLTFVGALIALAFVAPHRWETPGAVAGAALALPLEHRYLRYRPLRSPRRRQAPKVVIGLAVLVPLLLADALISRLSPILTFVLAGLAAAWGVLGAPVLFTRRQPEHQPGTAETRG